MAGSRRSTRRPTTRVPKYVEDDSSYSEDEAPKRNGKITERLKRVRDEDNSVNDELPPPKKALNATKPKSKPSKPFAKPISKSVNAPVAPPTVSETNRDADGNQEVYWLLKAEPLPRFEKGINVAFSIDDLASCTRPEPWTGVRNPQARNNMQAMRKGDLGFFYHSNAKPSGAVGILRVVEEAEVDETAFDSNDPYYDAKSDRAKPKWYCVKVEFVSKFDEVISLQTLKSHAIEGAPLVNTQLIRNGRLSVCRVGREEWKFVLGLVEGYERKEDSAVEKEDEVDAEPAGVNDAEE